MIIGNPDDLQKIAGFSKAFDLACRSRGLMHENFIGPDDGFTFTCQRSNVCCKNFSINDRIIIDPYDVLRLSRKLGISTGKFILEFAELTLDENTHFPTASLKYKGDYRRNKCHFLRSYGCSVYEDRPLRCRLYPLGRILDKGKSYFIRVTNCLCDKTKNSEFWSVREWIEHSRAEEHLDFQEIIGSLYFTADWTAYKNLSDEIKMDFANTIYDLDRFQRRIPGSPNPVSDEELMSRLAKWIEEFFKVSGCVKQGKETGTLCSV